MKKFIPLFLEIMMNNPSEARGAIGFHADGIKRILKNLENGGYAWN